MKSALKACVLMLALAMPLSALAAMTDSAPVVGIEEVKVLSKGWSAKKDILGKDVYNDSNEKIGSIKDIVISQDKAVSYAIIATGGFLGMGRHDVVVPANKLNINQKRIVFPTATKESLKAMPEFSYSR